MSESHLFGTVVRALDFFFQTEGVRIPWKEEIFVSYASFLCNDFHVVRWWLVWDWTLPGWKWLCVIINDDFLEKGKCYNLALLPSIICLGRLHIASKYIFSLWQLRHRIDSLGQWLEHWIFSRTDWVRIPQKEQKFFSAMLHSCVTTFIFKNF